MKTSIFLFMLCSLGLGAQNYTKTDSLKGSDNAYRNFWDVKRYELTVEADFDTKMVSGSNLIQFDVIKKVKDPIFQIDIQEPMKAAVLKSNFKIIKTEREGDFLWIHADGTFEPTTKYQMEISYSGNPKVARNAPWDGGWVFTKDDTGMPFMSVAQEGIGTSVWLPVKDHWADEPDNGIKMKIITPNTLLGVGNGRLIRTETFNDKKHYTWEVKNPINAYSIVPNIGNYVNFKDTYSGEKGQLDLDYWVLKTNLEKARTQFSQVKPMMKALEYWFGPYPFYEDSFKLVESPYLGMEHQSNVAYGNGYANGYLGRDLSGTGVGLKWDFILIHESGHEWFANNITAKDKADMWIHEAFTSYSETLFTENFLNRTDADRYVQGTRNNIQNDRPVIGDYGVRNTGSSDMYYKGANMLHTIRTIINDDVKFRSILRGINKDFYHQTVTSGQIENYISEKSGLDLTTVFDQYLRTTKIPAFVYRQNGKMLDFRYENAVNDLQLPLRINGNQLIRPTESWQQVELNSPAPVVFDNNYFVDYRKSN
ncbi:M1 family metallopeptidase [Marnyiella aurantia]|uniref:M1 family metallopeptidase n=1 Tax=Marnyiella aurantia TaxID=2758037 RepID=A0A7D7LTG1_9FLAO|nr:M1 family metallopeptidase [Marnyiella aurantia]MBA5246296.1 M1 family metallopeptidase [Marnyiella aurantia]QMS98333.1 M1 family metallopeptidase [Marnyiella aurantia]